MTQAETPLTIGERLVGKSFNPSQNEKVAKAKQLCTDLFDLVNDNYENPIEADGQHKDVLYETLFHHTVGEILNAQMNVVKVLTFKL